MGAEPWRVDFPDLEHEPQDLDLIRGSLARPTEERIARLVQLVRFVARARRGRWLGPAVPKSPEREP